MIDGIGRSPAASPARRAARGGGGTSGFALPPLPAGEPQAGDAAGAAEAAAAGDSAPVFAAYMAGLLGLQERGPADALSAPAARDREARRHGQALLSALAELQLLLTGMGTGPDGSPEDVRMLSERLSGLAASIPAAADPGLRGVVAAIGLRAQIELTRRLT